MKQTENKKSLRIGKLTKKPATHSSFFSSNQTLNTYCKQLMEFIGNETGRLAGLAATGLLWLASRDLSGVRTRRGGVRRDQKQQRKGQNDSVCA